MKSVRPLAAFGSLLLALPIAAPAQGALQSRLAEIMKRPEYKHARFGAAIYTLDGTPLYRLNEEQFFVPGSTTKLVTMGTALKLIGADYRFRTPMYRTGEISSDGVLHGDIVVAAAGDMNLSGRIQPDGSLAFKDEDHSYWPMEGAAPVTGDPIGPIRAMARQAAAKGIKRVTGQVYVDSSLFPLGDRELGSGAYLSPITINDNVIDVFVTAGSKPGDPTSIRLSPNAGFVNVTSHIKTGPAGSKFKITIQSDERRADGGRQITVQGSVPQSQQPSFTVYKMEDPVAFARFVFRAALTEAGIQFDSPIQPANPEIQWAAFYKPENLLAEHTSPPFIEDAKLTLKVSQNLHASTTPYLVGAIAGRNRSEPLATGFKLEKKLLDEAGLDTSGAMQTDGAGGAALYTPEFMSHYLIWLAKQPYFEKLRPGLPVMGRDGTLVDIQKSSPAAGKVFAKTGTYAEEDLLHQALLVTGKGLAGYMTTQDGHAVAFAFYVNFVPGDPKTITRIAGETLGELATAAWESEWK